MTSDLFISKTNKTSALFSSRLSSLEDGILHVTEDLRRKEPHAVILDSKVGEEEKLGFVK